MLNGSRSWSGRTVSCVVRSLKAISAFFAARPWAGSLSGDARPVPTDSGSGTPSVTRGYLRRGRRGRRRSTFARPYICRSIISEAGLIHRVLQQTSDHLVDRLPGRPGSGDGVLNGPPPAAAHRSRSPVYSSTHG